MNIKRFLTNLIVFVACLAFAVMAIEKFLSDTKISGLFNGSTIGEVEALGKVHTMRGRYFYACHCYGHAKDNTTLDIERREALVDSSVVIFKRIKKMAPNYERVSEALKLSKDIKNAIERKKG